MPALAEMSQAWGYGGDMFVKGSGWRRGSGCHRDRDGRFDQRRQQQITKRAAQNPAAKPDAQDFPAFQPEYYVRRLSRHADDGLSACATGPPACTRQSARSGEGRWARILWYADPRLRC